MARTILIIEDNDMERRLLSHILENEYDTVEASGGEEALAILEKKHTLFSAIILDIMLPGIDGYAVLHRVREDPGYRRIPVIVTTAFTGQASLEKAYEHGANGYVPKPFNQPMLLNVLRNAIELYETAVLVETLQRDRLTGLLNRESFLIEAERLIKSHENGYYVLSYINIDNFKVINDQYGTDKGDELLRWLAKCIEKTDEGVLTLACRISADRFAVLSTDGFENTLKKAQEELNAFAMERIGRSIRVRIGKYAVDDTSLSADAMLDRAVLAENSIRGRYDTYIAEYQDSLRAGLLHEQKIVNDMVGALERGEFEPWFQPQYNHATGALIGAEALVRWRKDGELVPPFAFIPIFERNGFICKMDRFIWEQVCILLRRWIDEGKEPLPISVNISRYDIIQNNFLSEITGLIEKYGLPVELLRLEITESAFAESTQRIVNIATELIRYGFTVEIDDFGSGYSSLNTLKDVPAQILKLDMKFLDSTQNTQRSGNIIESVVRMAKWLGMAVIAEGVEDKEHADYLKSIGCYYLQGYYYAKPMPLAEYEKLCVTSETEPKMAGLQTVDTWDNSAFWDPKSMETLVFNSYVGGACIFEYHDGKSEILRYNKEYEKIFSGSFAYDLTAASSDTRRFVDNEDKAKLIKNAEKAISSNEASTCEISLSDGLGNVKYLRLTVRMIARAGKRCMFYCVLVDITEQRIAEINEKESAQQLHVIMDNIDGGITAVTLENGEQKLLFTNDRFFTQMGYTREQFRKEFSDPFAIMLQEDRARVKAEAVEHNEAGQSFSTNYRIRHRDGSIRWMMGNISTTILPGGEKPVQLAVTTDVTKDKENAIKMNGLLNAIPGGVAAYRVGEKIETLYSSSGVAKLTGIDEKTYEKWRNEDIVTSAIFEGDAPKARQTIMDAVAAGAPINTSFRLKHVNGELVWVEFSASMIGEDVNGKIYYGVFTKPTAEAALYKSIVEDSAIGVIILEKKSEKRIIYANPVWRRIEGVSDLTTITGVPVKQVLTRKEEFIPDEIIKSLPSDEFYEMYMKSQTGIDIVLQARSLIWNGVDAYVCYIKDNSEQVKREAAQRKLLDNLPCGAGVYRFKDGEMSLIYQNKSYWELVGLNEEAFPDPSAMSAIHPDDIPLVMSELSQAVQHNRDVSCDIRLRHLSEGYRRVHLASRVAGEESGALSIYATFTPEN